MELLEQVTPRPVLDLRSEDGLVLSIENLGLMTLTGGAVYAASTKVGDLGNMIFKGITGIFSSFFG